MRRVLVISYAFPPNSEVGAQSCAQILRYLPLYAWEPIVLTVRENCIEVIDRSSIEPFAVAIVRTRVLPHPLTLYKHLKTAFRSNATGIVSGDASDHTPGTLHAWLLSILMVPDKYAGWIIPAVIAGLKAIRRYRPSHLFSTAPYWTSHIVGLILSQLTGIPWTAHFRDPWSHPTDVKTTSNVLSRHLNSLLEQLVVSRASAVVCVTKQHTALMQKTYRALPSEKFLTIPNGFDGAEWDAMESEFEAADVLRSKRFVITHAGSLYAARNPLPLFRAVRELIDSGEVDRNRIRICLIGDSAFAEGQSVKELTAACGLCEIVSITGVLNRAETLPQILQSHLLVVLAEGWTHQIPAKTYEYLRARRPILALTSAGALADLLKQTGGAWVVNPADVTEVARAVRTAYQDWIRGRLGCTADAAVVARFDRRVLAGRFAEVFSRCNI